MSALILALIAAAVAGFSRGFAAFGTAMIYVPLVALAYDAKTAVVTLFLVDLIPAMPLVWKAAPQCDRPTMLWMTLGALALSPLGVAVLLVADPMQSQLVLGLILLTAVSIMAFRPGLRLAASRTNGVLAGAASGFAGGLCGIYGPPAMIYLLGRGTDAQRTRADTVVFLTGESLVLGLTYWVYGLYTWTNLELALMLMPVYGIGLWLGARCFSQTGEAVYRKLVLGLLWVISVVLVVQAAVRVF